MSLQHNLLVNYRPQLTLFCAVLETYVAYITDATQDSNITSFEFLGSTPRTPFIHTTQVTKAGLEAWEWG